MFVGIVQVEVLGTRESPPGPSPVLMARAHSLLERWRDAHPRSHSRLAPETWEVLLQLGVPDEEVPDAPTGAALQAALDPARLSYVGVVRELEVPIERFERVDVPDALQPRRGSDGEFPTLVVQATGDGVAAMRVWLIELFGPAAYGEYLAVLLDYAALSGCVVEGRVRVG